LLTATGLATTLVSTLAVSAFPAAADPLPLGPTVRYTGTAPTGYEVTFRYEADASVPGVMIYGEWYFTQPGTFDMRLGSAWMAGDFPSGSGRVGGWGQEPMAKGADGVWEWTTPLPSGTFSYRYVECATAATCSSGANRADPYNLPWSNQPAQVMAGSHRQSMSQVYVPSSREYPTYDNDYQAPPRAGQGGTLVPVGYVGGPAGTDSLKATVWLPPGYDANRATPYPMFFLTHGGGGVDTDWATQGIGQNIVANAIAAGEVQPMVLVMGTYNPDGGQSMAQSEEYAKNLRDYLIPLLENRYNVSHDPSDRAIAGLSQGGGTAHAGMYGLPELFGFWCLWSVGNANDQDTEITDPVLRARFASRLAIQIATGEQDNLAMISNNARVLSEAGANVVFDTIPGVHSWDVWRQLFREIITKTAFRLTDAVVSPVSGAKAGTPVAVTATVTPKSSSNAAARGKVEFYLDSPSGTKLGEAPVGPGGQATGTVVFPASGTQQVVAVYSGDNYLNTSTSTALPLTVAKADPLPAPQVVKKEVRVPVPGPTVQVPVPVPGPTVATGAPAMDVAKVTTAVKVTATKFKKNSKPKVTVTVTLNTGSATGKVAIFVNGKKVKTVNAIGKTTRITLPKTYSKAINVKAKYTPTKGNNGTAKVSPVVRVRTK
jgi:enterochelin esterase-like enzyme